MAKQKKKQGMALNSRRRRKVSKQSRPITGWKDLLPQSKKIRRGLILLLYLSVLFGLLLINQARIAQKGFDNARVENMIRRLSIQNAQKREDLLKRDDIARVREEAERLGMSLPLEGQLKRVHVARQDYMSFSDKDDQQILQDFDLQRALHNVARYRSSITPASGPVTLPFGRDLLQKNEPQSTVVRSDMEMESLDLTGTSEVATTAETELNGENTTDDTNPTGE